MIKRNEYKFPFIFENNVEVIQFIKKENMFQRQPMRIVNSFYFDSPNLKFHLDGEEGILPRDKVRFRFYGNKIRSLINSNLEIKSAFYNHREKLSEVFSKISKNSLGRLNDFKKKIMKKTLIPTLGVTYKRLYFENNFQLRMTLDYGICYKKYLVKNNLVPIITATKYDTHNVVEVKGSGVKADVSILNSKMQWQRFSKYSRGHIFYEV